MTRISCLLRNLPRKLSILSFVFACVVIASGQATSGDIAGSVKDATGALLPNATVVVKAESTGVVTTVTANSSGEFHVSNLLADRYDISVTAAGFQPYTLRGVEVSLNKTSTESITMSIGTSTTVEVSADAGVVLDTTTTNLTTTFSNEGSPTFPRPASAEPAKVAFLTPPSSAPA